MDSSLTILLLRGTNPEGKPIFAYVALRAVKLREYIKEQKSEMFDPVEKGSDTSLLIAAIGGGQQQLGTLQ